MTTETFRSKMAAHKKKEVNVSKDVIQVILATILFIVIAAASQITLPSSSSSPSKNGVVTAHADKK